MADSLEEQIKKYLRSKEGQAKVAINQKTNKDFGKGNGSGGTEQMARDYAVKMKEFIRDEVAGIDGLYTDGFLDHIDISVEFKNGDGWIADVFFNESKVYRSSFSNSFSNDIYLPTLLNNPWKSNPKNKIYGVWHDRLRQYSSDKYMDGDFKGFIFRAVENFKKQVDKNIEIVISSDYK